MILQEDAWVVCRAPIDWYTVTRIRHIVSNSNLGREFLQNSPVLKTDAAMDYLGPWILLFDFALTTSQIFFPLVYIHLPATAMLCFPARSAFLNSWYCQTSVLMLQRPLVSESTAVVNFLTSTVLHLRLCFSIVRVRLCR